MDAVSSELLPGESVLWTATPVQLPFVSRYDVPLVAFVFAWLSFAVFWEVSAVRGVGNDSPAPWPIALFGGLMIVFGVVNLCTVTIRRRMRLANTRYVVTDQRVILVSTIGKGSVRSAYLWQLPPTAVTDASGPRGSVVFGDTSYFRRVAARWSAMSQAGTRGAARARRRPQPDLEIEYVADAYAARDIIAAQQQRLVRR